MEKLSNKTKADIEQEMDAIYKQTTAYQFERLQEVSRRFWLVLLNSILKTLKLK